MKFKLSKLKVEKAGVEDAVGIRDLILHYARQELMLPRTLSSIYEDIRDYYVVKNGGHVVGVCGLRIFWKDLAEVRSLAVHPDFQKKGLGKKLVNLCLKEAKKMGIKKIFILTMVPGFFRKIGFREADADALPMKVWGECKDCPRFMECNEVPMVIDLK